MITTVLYPEHFATAGPKDIERELIDLTLEQAARDASEHAHGMWMVSMHPGVRKALMEGGLGITIMWVRTARYHPPSRPGWTTMGRMRWGKHKTNLIDVQWVPRKLPWC
jgi:hypothetical protein